MQTITKTELAWIYSALEHEVMRSVEAMNDSDYGSLEYQIAEHNKEKLRGTMNKIHAILNEGSKRIAVK